jgi:hypothetical protein
MSIRFAATCVAALCLLGRAWAQTPVDTAQCAAMMEHHVLHDGAPVGCERLSVVRFSYIDFAGRRHDDGAIVVLDAVAPAVQRIFATLYARRFPIAKAQTMEAYDGDDAAAMANNNSSGFNHRAVKGTARLSLHAYGAAIDLNPMQNPYLTRTGDTVTVAPPGGVDYLNRRDHRPGKAERAGMAETVVEVFAENGFIVWGGDWDDPIDYQHFDIGRAAAESLVSLPPEKARQAFEDAARAYQHCAAQYSDKTPAERRQICAARPQN